MPVPEKYHRGELFWWQENEKYHTLISVWFKPLSIIAKSKNFGLDFVLFDSNGTELVCWQQQATAQEFLIWDSKYCKH